MKAERMGPICGIVLNRLTALCLRLSASIASFAFRRSGLSCSSCSYSHAAPLAYSGFWQQLQPSLPLFGLVDSAARCSDATRPVNRFDPGHRALGIDRQRLIGTHQLL